MEELGTSPGEKHPFIKIYVANFQEGFLQQKLTFIFIKRPFEIRIVAKFSTFYGKYGNFPHRFMHFFVVTDVYALFDIPSEKSAK